MHLIVGSYTYEKWDGLDLSDNSWFGLMYYLN